MGFKRRHSLTAILKQPEGTEVEYKETVRAISVESLVAFANLDGGTIVAGIRDPEWVPRSQDVCGCRITDDELRSIEQKASSCMPPVRVFVEPVQYHGKMLVRVDVPPSRQKPHCTSGGTYKIRDGRANRAIGPSALLRMFVDKEGDQFLARFIDATKNMEGTLNLTVDELEALNSSIVANVGELAKGVAVLEQRLDTLTKD